jgi:hypothetical protein
MGRQGTIAAVTDPGSIAAEYRRRLDARRATLAGQERTHAQFSYARLALAATAGLLFVLFGWTWWLAVPIAGFAITAVLHARLLNARDRAASAASYYERGLARMQGAWIGHGRTGEPYLPADHLYAADLDLFGRGSLFELLATTRTRMGEETLARWLLAPAPPDLVRQRQEAVAELVPRIDLRETIAVMGDRLEISVDAALLRRWAASPIVLRGRAARPAFALLSAATVGSFAVWLATGAWGAAALVFVVLQSAAAQWLKPPVQAVIHAVEAPSHDMDLVASLLDVIEREAFASAGLREVQRAVARTGRPASAEIQRLSRLVALLASRRNVMFAVPAALMLWATQWAFAIEAWRGRAGAEVPHWLDAIGEFEALVALATFAAEHPHYPFPAIAEGPAMVSATALAHPALPESAIPNDVALDSGGLALLVVSGSNMSGKSTLLRTLGVNVVLAHMGAPVRASSFRLSPLALGAAIRVQDSLTDGRSRFFAEITRIKQVVDLASGRRGSVLFLLDEILAGTNSHDRRVGAEAVLKGLVDLGAIGLATTHDLALGEIVSRLDGRAANVHFVDHLDAGALRFDYRLRPGIVQSSNALALMRAVGLDV